MITAAFPALQSNTWVYKRTISLSELEVTRGIRNGKELQEDGLIAYGDDQTVECQFTGNRLGGRIVNMK